VKKAPVILLTAALMLSLPAITSSAQEVTDSLSLKVYFRQDVSELELDYRNNGLFLDKFTAEVSEIMEDPGCRIQDIYIRSSASPEGKFDHNKDLSFKRGKQLKDFLQKQLLIPDDKFVVDAVGEDWAALRRLVERNNVPDKEKILKILDKYADYINGNPTSVIGGPKKELMDLNGGKTWFWLLDNIYPDLRSAGNSIICRYTRLCQEEPREVGHIIDTIVVIHEYEGPADSTRAIAAGAYPYPNYQIPEGYAPKMVKAKKVRTGPKYRFAIETNLLFDAALSPNVALEFPIGKRISLLASHHFPWYTWGDNRFAYQIMNSTGEVRFWLGDRTKRSVLTGGYLGLYGGYGKADLELESKGYQVPYTWHAGLTGGWSFPLGRSDNWRLDLGLTVGYLPYTFDYYERSEASGKLIYKSSGEGLWIGPTNVKCSIVWMIPMNKKVPKPAKVEKQEKQTKTTKTNNAK